MKKPLFIVRSPPRTRTIPTSFEEADLRYLITGGAGFIGSHLAERLLQRNEKVVLLDNLSTGSMENIRHLKGSEHLDYHLDGIENKQLLAELVDDADIIVHFAAAVGVKLIVESPVRTIETNVHGTELVLEAASKKKKLVLLASTSEVYGKNTQVPFHEDADLVLGPTTKGRWSYAASKALDEFLALCLLEGEKTAGHRRPILQHGWTAPDGALRDGLAEFCAARLEERADRGLRGWQAVALLLRRARYGRGAAATVPTRTSRRRSHQYRQHGRSVHRESGEARQGADGKLVLRFNTSRTTKPMSRASRT